MLAIFLITTMMAYCCLAAPSSSLAWQSMSPFEVKKMDAGWGENWLIRGQNWRHNVRRKIATGAGAFDDASGLPIVVVHSFSTCSDSTPPKRNGLSSATYYLPHNTPLPTLVTAEISFIISEACLEAQRPHCGSLELWLLEGVAPTDLSLLTNDSILPSQSPYTKASFLSDSIAWPGAVGTTVVPPVDTKKGGTEGAGSNVRKASISFVITRPPFKLQFRDRRGACLDIVNMSLSIKSCYVGSAKKLPLFNATAAAIEETAPSTTTNTGGPTTLPPIGMTTPSQDELLSTLDCKCPPGYRRPAFDRCEACPPDTFSNEPHINAFCSPCPSRSTAPFAGSTICICEEGAFRAQGETETEPCTMPPSTPRQLIATYFDVHTVTVNWTEPEDFGGRSDITYQVQCVAGCEDVTVTRKDPLGVLRAADIKSRESLETSFVTIRVYALNGVSAIAGPSYAKYFEAVITLRSSDTDAAYAHIPDRVFILVGIFGGAGLVAAFFVVYALLRHFRDRRRGQPMIVIASSNSEDALDPNKVKVSDVASDDEHNQQTQQQQPLIMATATNYNNNNQGDAAIAPSSRQNLLLIQNSPSTDDAKAPLVDISSSSTSATAKNSSALEQISPLSNNEAPMSTSTSILSS